jgi:hypothetical protein
LKAIQEGGKESGAVPFGAHANTQERSNYFGVKVRSCAPGELGAGIVERHSFLVGTHRGHDFEGIGNRHDARAEWQF